MTQDNWVCRPWGRFLTVYTAPGIWVKTLTINPSSRLSLQIHRHRDEIWHSPEGRLQAVIGTETLDLSADMVYRVPRGTPHRLINPSRYELSIVEVAIGNPTEEDIIRLSDIYGRLER